MPVGYSFEWDPDKDETNRRKHGVSFEEAATVFGDPLSLNMDDPDHSTAEQRYIVVGLSERYRLLLISYVAIEQSTRIISARQVTRAERKHYEEG